MKYLVLFLLSCCELSSQSPEKPLGVSVSITDDRLRVYGPLKSTRNHGIDCIITDNRIDTVFHHLGSKWSMESRPSAECEEWSYGIECEDTHRDQYFVYTDTFDWFVVSPTEEVLMWKIALTDEYYCEMYFEVKSKLL